MASYLDPDFHEAEFVGRDEFLGDLDTAWKNNTRIFGIFGLRSVGKTRTAFEFIRRKREEYSDQIENTKVQNKLSETKTDKSHGTCDEEKDASRPGSRDLSKSCEYETDQSQRKCNANNQPDSKGSSSHSEYESNKSQRNCHENKDDDQSGSEAPSKYLEYETDQSQRKYDGHEDDNQTGSEVSSKHLKCETDKSQRKIGTKYKDIQRESDVQTCNLESEPKECDTNFDDKDSESQATEQRLDSETGEVKRNYCADCVYVSKNNFTGKETEMDDPTRNGHANCVNESKNNVNSTESTATDGKTLDGLTETFKHVSIREETSVKPLEVFYIDLHKFKNFGVFSSQVFAQFGTAPKVRNVDDFVVQLVNVIDKTNNKINVILFDNSEDAVEGRLDFSLQDIASKLVQRCKSVRIIITATTNARFAQVGKVFKTFELKPMTDIDSTKLLRCLTPNIEFKGYFDRIVTLCAGLPLALMMVAAELAAGTGSAEMVQMLAECRIKALSKENYPVDRRLGRCLNHC